MSDHSPFVRVRDRACFDFAHGGKRFLNAFLHRSEKIIRKAHSADVDREIEIIVAQKILLKPRPERSGSHFVCVTETPCRLEHDCFCRVGQMDSHDRNTVATIDRVPVLHQGTKRVPDIFDFCSKIQTDGSCQTKEDKTPTPLRQRPWRPINFLIPYGEWPNRIPEKKDTHT